MIDLENETVQLEITLKSGAQITADVTDWSVRKGVGGISELKWTTAPDAKRRLVRVDIDEVAAIIEVRP